ncbi:hypothetical protein IWW57_001137 [Coemansia sp. S610]|nr:hypothetical protein IWW57_001137 [Coemansia sp. S610]
MDSAPFDYFRSSIDQLAMTKQLLLACIDMPEQDVGGISQSNIHIDLAEDVVDVGAVEPLTHERLDEIKRGIGVSKSTWENLREKYPPGKSDFAPLSFTASSWAAIANAGPNRLGDDPETDECLS